MAGLFGNELTIFRRCLTWRFTKKQEKRHKYENNLSNSRRTKLVI